MLLDLNKYLFISLLLLALACPSGTSAKDVCAQASDREQVQCLSQAIDAAKRELETVYQAVFAKVSVNDRLDRRASRDQLVKAQNAWQAYVEANCAYVGGTEGGSNLWITNFASRCELQEVHERTAFLRKQLPKRPSN